MLEPLGEVCANFSLQLSSRTQFTKINNKKVIAKNQCEKHKKSSLGSVEWNHLCNFGRRHHEEQFCTIILNLDHFTKWRVQWFMRFLIRSSGSPPVQWSGTTYAILE